jgi:predicted amidohydrolase
MTNLLPELNNFMSWSPTPGQTPKFIKEPGILGICGGGNSYRFGKWTGTAAVRAGATYEAAVEFMENDAGAAYMLLNWRDSEGKSIRREYPDQRIESGGGWVRLCRTAQAPGDAFEAEVELSLTGPGSVRWRNASFIERDEVTPRPVRIASAFFEPRRKLDKNMEVMLELADRAGEQKADVLLFTESGYDRGVTPISVKGVSIPGDVTGRFSEKARQYQCNILVNLTEEEDGFYFNTTVLIDRTGRLIGKYRKVHLPTGEQESGYSPGNELPVFEMDFGKVGVLTCFDIEFFEAGRVLRNKGAEIIFLPTIGNYLMNSQMQARWHGLYVVVSGAHPPHPSRIIDPHGELIASVDGEADGIAFAEINLAEGIYCQGTGFWPAVSDARNSLFWKRRKGLYQL